MKTIKTTLGFPLNKKANFWKINLTDLSLFRGLSVLSKILNDKIFEQIENEIGDISFLYKINPDINPDFLEMEISAIQVYVKANVFDDAILDKEKFHYHLRTILGTLQRPSWAQKIHPEFYGEEPPDGDPIKLVFPFEILKDVKTEVQFTLERVEKSRNSGNFFLRLTVDEANPAEANNTRLLVHDIEDRIYIIGITKLSESVSDKILTAISKGFINYSEDNTPYSSLFAQLHKTHLEKVDQINFHWTRSFSELLQEYPKTERIQFFKTIFVCLEDQAICKLLQNGETVQVERDSIHVNLYLTRLSRVLNFSIGKDKKNLSLDSYLKKMPRLEKVSNSKLHGHDFSNTRIFLIHHITSEIIALIEAIRRLGADAMDVIFVKYAGLIPSAYLDVLLDIPDKNFFMAGLTRHITENNHEFFTPANYYSDISAHTHLHQHLAEKKLDFFNSMKYLACYFFLRFLAKAVKDKKKIIIIEDGGYLAPILNEYCLDNLETQQVYASFGLQEITPKVGKFSELCANMVIGSVEHTRNGYDRLAAILQKQNRLAGIAYSIAISNNKVVEESKEVAHSILSAIESILHGQGMVLSSKKIIMLGAKGNIGSFLSQYLIAGRLHETNKEIVKIDIRYDSTTPGEYCFLSEIPEESFLSLELFIGVIGKSIFTHEFIAKLILFGKKNRLIFASGSTKTVEFSDLSKFLFELYSMPAPNINGIPVKITYDKIIDPQTNMAQGSTASISFQMDGINYEKTLFLLGDLSPINFLFYGVPTETMDYVISQLTSVSLGLLKQYRAKRLPAPGLYAVDHEIDEWGEPLGAAPSGVNVAS